MRKQTAKVLGVYRITDRGWIAILDCSQLIPAIQRGDSVLVNGALKLQVKNLELLNPYNPLELPLLLDCPLNVGDEVTSSARTDPRW